MLSKHGLQTGGRQNIGDEFCARGRTIRDLLEELALFIQIATVPGTENLHIVTRLSQQHRITGAADVAALNQLRQERAALFSPRFAVSLPQRR